MTIVCPVVYLPSLSIHPRSLPDPTSPICSFYWWIIENYSILPPTASLLQPVQLVSSWTCCKSLTWFRSTNRICVSVVNRVRHAHRWNGRQTVQTHSDSKPRKWRDKLLNAGPTTILTEWEKKLPINIIMSILYVFIWELCVLKIKFLTGNDLTLWKHSSKNTLITFN